MRKIRCAVLGGTGNVGQRFIKMLDNHPFFDISLIIASKRNEGKQYIDAVHWLMKGDIPSSIQHMKIRTFNIDIFKKMNVDIVFSALTPEIAAGYEKQLAENGYMVFSNSRAYRLDPMVPILIPEVNPDHIKLVDVQKKKYKHNGYIVTNPNCSTTGLAIVLKPLLKYKPKNVFVSTYQALSGAGYPGVSAVDINDNVIPYIKDEEEKIRDETKKILGTFQKGIVINSNINVVSSCVRVPVRDGHLESVVVKFEKDDDVDIESVKQVLRSFHPVKNLPTAPSNPIIVRDEIDRPQPLFDKDAGGHVKGMSVTVGRVEKQGGYIRFFLVVHNTIRGGAGNSILNAEYAIQKGYI